MPGKYDTFSEKVKADVIRVNGTYSFALLLKSVLFDRTFRPVFTMRLCQNLSVGGIMGRILLLPCRLLHGWMTQMAGIDFSWRTVTGAGFLITHGWGLVITSEAVIGRNVTVFHGVTIGRKDKILPNGERITTYPTIEDEVWIGPHAVIVGGITVGRGSRIAAGTVVLQDVAPYSIVGENPMRVLATDSIPDVYNPAQFEE
jgi:serine O-acetyltransferase